MLSDEPSQSRAEQPTTMKSRDRPVNRSREQDDFLKDFYGKRVLLVDDLVVLNIIDFH